MSRQEHPIWEEELMPYVDGQLDDAQAAGITRHLETCEACAAAVADARGLSQQMTSWKVEDSSEQMGLRVVAELRSQEKRRLSRQRWAWWTNRRAWAYGLGGALAATVLVTVVVTNTNRYRYDKKIAAMPAPSEGLSSIYEYEKAAPKVELAQPQGQQGQPGKQLAKPSQAAPASAAPEAPAGPMVIRTARLIVVTKDFDGARSRIEAIVRQSQGYLDQLTARGEVGTGRTLSASLRLPSDRIESGLVELRKIGKVREESQGSSDVTSQYVDLEARLRNARNTEQRMLNLLRERTGKLEEVVNAEREISRVREEIERMEVQRKDMTNRVQYATIQLEVSEEYRAEVEPSTPSAGTRMRNAMIDGYHGAVESVVGTVLLVLLYAPSLLLWSAVLLPFVLLLRRRFQISKTARS